MFSFTTLSFPHFLASLYVSGAITAIKLLSSVQFIVLGSSDTSLPHGRTAILEK